MGGRFGLHTKPFSSYCDRMKLAAPGPVMPGPIDARMLQGERMGLRICDSVTGIGRALQTDSTAWEQAER